MGRFDPTGRLEVGEHSVIALQWATLRGAHGPSDGSGGPRSNVPSALSVLRHAPLYRELPEEIEEAFDVLENHALRHRLLYPVALAIVPFLFDVLRHGSVLAERIEDLVAEYAAAAGTLEPRLTVELVRMIVDHGPEIAKWTNERAIAALAIHVPALRGLYLARLRDLPVLAPAALLGLVALGADDANATRLAHAALDDLTADPMLRMAAAAYLARGEHPPDLRARIAAALPLSAPAALATHVRHWTPEITRPVVAPKLHDAEVVFSGEKLVQVRAGKRNITLPWVGAAVRRGDRLKVGITAHGQPKLVVMTAEDGSVRVIDF